MRPCGAGAFSAARGRQSPARPAKAGAAATFSENNLRGGPPRAILKKNDGGEPDRVRERRTARPARRAGRGDRQRPRRRL